ncbi:MAG: hypothetical protein E7462_06620 [Ruminococcaceae bacterium]|nr:hypothetical protein [Oscillospiraceae bacterium]
MEYANLMQYASCALVVIACLVFGVNIAVEVVKKLFPKVPTAFLAAGLSVALTMTAFFAWAAWKQVTVLWYHVAAALILGVFVAYAAMFGFDKFRQALDRLKDWKK